MTTEFNERKYQNELRRDIYDAWGAGHRNVLAVLPTGGGKTHIFSQILRDHGGAACAIAHRQELVCQMSTTLARHGVPHRIIGPKNVIKQAVESHVAETKRSYYNPGASIGVAGVDTLVRRPPGAWADSVSLWVQDEAHHLLTSNKWGRAVAVFPNARGLGVTATPERADGRGLGAHADGVFDVMVQGPTMRKLICDGYLTDYRVFALPSAIDRSRIRIDRNTGELNHAESVAAMRNSKIVGDTVDHYLRIAHGKLGVTFVTDVATANDIAAKFNARGVPAAALSAKTPHHERHRILRQFRERTILQLINVDLFGEGFDLPAIEVVSMARPTESFSLFTQQFGRALRLMLGKTRAIIIDHVGNVIRHGLPDQHRVWTMDAREKRSGIRTSADALRSCPNPTCLSVYPRFHACCPYCGHHVEPTARSGPEFVDGDLTELDAATLAQLRGEIARVDQSTADYGAMLAARGAPVIGQRAHMARHQRRQTAQAALRSIIAWWAGHERARGLGDSDSYRKFYLTYGVDVLSAQALGADDALALADRIARDF